MFRGHLATVGVFRGQLTQMDAAIIHNKSTRQIIATANCSVLCDSTISPSGYDKIISEALRHLDLIQCYYRCKEGCKCESSKCVCSKVPGICQTAGASHFRSFDGLAYDFKGSCEYLLARDTKGDFEIRLQNELCANGTTISTKAVSITTSQSDSSIVFRESTVLIDGNVLDVLPYTSQSCRYKIYKEYGIVYVLLRGRLPEDDVEITWNGKGVVKVTVSQLYVGRVRGLCGNFNGNTSDDLLDRYGDMETAIEKGIVGFGSSWAVESGNRILLSPRASCRLPPSRPSPCEKDPSLRRRAEDYCHFINSTSGPYLDCHGVIDASDYYRFCLDDVCANNDICRNPCQSIRAYEDICRSRGRVIGTFIDKSCNNGATCSAWGDPHYTTFDGIRHHFQGQCEYVFVQDCLRNDFAVHVQNGHKRGESDCLPNNFGVKVQNEHRREIGDVTWTKAVAVRIRNSSVIQIKRGNKVIINSHKVRSFPHRLSGDGTIVRRTGEGVEVHIASSDVVVTFDGKHRIAVRVPKSYLNRTCGLCGIYDNDPANDMSLRNGSIVVPSNPDISYSPVSQSAYYELGVSWAVEGKDRLLLPSDDLCNDTKPEPPICDEADQCKAEEYCAEIKSPRYSKCHSIVDPKVYFDSCVFDICGCNGDTGCGCDSIKEYESTCRDRGVTGFSSVVDECGVCYGNGSCCGDATCDVYGDPHYRTFDDSLYHFQGHCEYVLTEDCQHEDFQITVQNEHRHGNNLVSYVRSVAIKIYKVAIIKLLLNKVTVVNNVQLTENQLPFTIGVDGTVIERTRDETDVWIKVTLSSSRVRVFWNGKNKVKIVAPDHYKNRLCGLCGTFDGNKSNDLTLRNGTVLQPTGLTDTSDDYSTIKEYHQFGVDWTISKANRLLIPQNESCEDGPQPPNPCNVAVRDEAHSYCKVIKDRRRYGVCHQFVNAKDYYSTCMYDTCSCLSDGKHSCYCTSVDAFEQACRKVGVTHFNAVVNECGQCNRTCPPPPTAPYCEASIGHVYTFQKDSHDREGNCEYTLLRDCEKDEFSVHYLNRNRYQTKLSQEQALLAIRVSGGAITKVWRNSTVQVNGRTPYSFPYKIDGGVVTKSGHVVKVMIASSDVQVVWDGVSATVNVTVPFNYYNRTRGLCSSLNENYLFCSTRTVKKEDRLLLSPQDTCSPPPNCSSNALKSALGYCNVLTQDGQRYGACQSVLDPTEHYNLCIKQICDCNGNKSCGCSAIKAYESQCRNVAGNDVRVGTIVDECGECYGDGKSCKYANCTIFSTPMGSITRANQEYITFDCLVHRFQGSCEYVLARDCKGGLFDIHIENTSPFPNAIGSAWTRAVAIRAAGLGVIKIFVSLHKPIVYLNDERLSWPSTTSAIDGSQILLFSEVFEDRVEIHLARTKVKVFVLNRHQVVVSVPPNFRNRLCGLCGNDNGNSIDDLTLPNGKFLKVSKVKGSTSARSVSNYHIFGKSWAAPNQRRLTLDPAIACRDPQEVPFCDQNPENKRHVEEFCDIILDPKGPFANCHAHTRPHNAYTQCVLDGCLHKGNRASICPSIRSYQTRCQKCNKQLSLIVPECIEGIDTIFKLKHTID